MNRLPTDKLFKMLEYIYADNFAIKIAKLANYYSMISCYVKLNDDLMIYIDFEPFELSNYARNFFIDKIENEETTFYVTNSTIANELYKKIKKELKFRFLSIIDYWFSQLQNNLPKLRNKFLTDRFVNFENNDLKEIGINKIFFDTANNIIVFEFKNNSEYEHKHNLKEIFSKLIDNKTAIKHFKIIFEILAEIIDFINFVQL